jgi:hypothetical protein
MLKLIERKICRQFTVDPRQKVLVKGRRYAQWVSVCFE